jgi:hypothetical protein
MNCHLFVSRAIPLGGAWTLLLLVGCGPSTGTITGKVTYDDKPLTSGTVMFLADDNRSFPSSISSDGTYKVENVPLGHVRITVAAGGGGAKIEAPRGFGKIPKGAPTEAFKAYKGATARSGVSIPMRYANPDQSGLSTTVVAGSQEYNIVLQSDKKGKK